jgi:3',5'-cyclic-AMP phosphodiesterase
VLTWYTASAPAPAVPYEPAQEPAPVVTDGVVRYGTDPQHLDHEAREHGAGTAYHYVEVTGLRPGTTYYYQACSAGVTVAPRVYPQLTFPPGGLVIPPDPTSAQLVGILARLLSSGVVLSASPGSVTTLVPPRGRLLFTVALSNDIHVGETVSGLATSDFPPGFAQRPGLPPYPVVMAESMTADAAARGADVLLVAGDLSAACLPGQLSGAKALLDKFGHLSLSGRLRSGDYVVARGNHDQPQHGSAYAARIPVGTTGYYDCVPAVYDLPQGKITATEVGGLRLVGLDTTTLNLPGGALNDLEFGALEQVLADNPDQPTLVFGHHPVTDGSAYSTIAGPSFDLDRADAARVDFLEVAATKEYPGGFTLLRVYEGGYLANFYKSSSALARQ